MKALAVLMLLLSLVGDNPRYYFYRLESEIAAYEEGFYADSMGASDLDFALMKDIRRAGDWVYFLYPYEYDGYTLLRWHEESAVLESLTNRCDRYEVVDEVVYFASFSSTGDDHGLLFRLEPGGEPIQMAGELASGYQVIPPHIYYYHSFDTIGVGIEGHALHRIDLNGENHMIVAYETVGPGVGGAHHAFYVDGEYAYLRNIRIRMGEPADGSERVELIAPLHGDYGVYEGMELDGWIYYSSNTLYRCREDGSEQQRLDGDENSWIEISKIDDEWIYYNETFFDGYYKIRRDGTEKTEIDYDTANSA